ncbi:MAG: MerC family mercury resistance protein [Pseudomonadota bacterium]
MLADLIKQFGSVLGASFAAACCLGVTAALSAVTAIGAGFLINDAFLIPLYGALLGLSVWLLYRSTRAHGSPAPFYLGLSGAIVALVGLWVGPFLVYGGLAAIVAGSVWDFQRKRRQRACSSN